MPIKQQNDTDIPDIFTTFAVVKLSLHTYNLQSNTGNGGGSHFEVHTAFIDGLVLVIDVFDG